MTVFVCQDNFDSILCGVYDAWMSRLGHSNVRLGLNCAGNLELFCEYRDVEVTEDKLNKVISAIRQKISAQAYETVFHASLSKEEDKADKIYRFLIYGFHYGNKVMDMLQLPEVYDVFQMRRNIWHEQHSLFGFVRFSQMEEGMLLGRIGPKNDVLILLAPHFADRLSGENWILYDENRQKAILHPADRQWVMMKIDSDEWRTRLNQATDESVYENLWKCFRKSVTIQERRNPVCQRNHMAMRYRPYMTEFQGAYGLTDER